MGGALFDGVAADPRMVVPCRQAMKGCRSSSARAPSGGHAAIQAALDRGGARDAAAVARGSFPLARATAFGSAAAAAAAGDLYSLDGASFPGWPAAGIPTKAIDFIDNASYGSRMGQLQPLVTRRYADFGMQRSAICHPSGIAAR